MRYPKVTPSLICGAVVIGALLSGCGSSSSTGTSPQSGAASAGTQFLGYATCMRSHGLAGYPDPQVSASGNNVQVRISPGNLNPDSPAFKSADRACHHLLPDGGGQGGAGGSSAQQQAQDLRYAECMRSDGVPAFPDPDHDGVFTLPATINEHAPSFLRATDACQKVQPTSLSIDQHT